MTAAQARAIRKKAEARKRAARKPIPNVIQAAVANVASTVTSLTAPTTTSSPSRGRIEAEKRRQREEKARARRAEQKERERIRKLKARSRTTRDQAASPFVVEDAEGIRLRQFGPTSSRLQAPIIVETADRGPRSGPVISPEEARLQGATARFMQRGPIGQRTAGVDTPWQERERPKRREAKKNIIQLAAANFHEAWEGTRDQPGSAPLRNPFEGNQGLDPSLYGLVPDAPIEYNKRHALREEDQGFLGDLWSAIKPGGGLDQVVEESSSLRGIAEKSQEFAGWLDSLGERSEDWLRGYLGNASVDVSVGPGVTQRHEAASIGSAPLKIVPQIASALAYTPAFVYYGITDPRGTAAGIADFARQAVDDPTKFLLERPGDALMLLIGAKGLVSGRLPNVVTAAVRGDLRATIRAAVTPAKSTGALVRGTPLSRVRTDQFIPGARGRELVRQREMVARIESAKAEALAREARKLTFRKPDHVTHRQALRAQSEAIRAVMEQTTPRERAAYFQDALTLTGNPAARRRLGNMIEANQIVEQLNLVGKVPVPFRRHPIISISKQHPALAALTERVIQSSEVTEKLKLDLGLLVPEQAAIRRNAAAEIINPSYRRQTATNNPPRLPSGVVDLGPTRYSSYKVDDLTLKAVVPQRIRDRLGIPQKPGAHAFTGKGLMSGRVGDVIKLTAKEELATLQYQIRLQAWKEAVASSLTGEELLAKLAEDRGKLRGDRLADYAAVRVKPGASGVPTKEILSKLLDTVEIDSGRIKLIDVTGKRMSIWGDEMLEIAKAADDSGQVKFFKPDEIGLKPLEMSRLGPVRSTMHSINTAAKFSVLFLAGPAYLIPNLMGQMGFSHIHKGLRALPNDFWAAPKALKRLDPETRLRVRALTSRGIVQALLGEQGPMSALRRVNELFGKGYSKILDDFWRDGAFYYEAKARGYKTPEQIKRLMNEGTKKGTKEYKDLMEIKYAIDEHFGAFERITDFEKRYVSEMVFFWPWIRASAILAAKLPIHHPLKAAFLEIGGSYSFEKAEQDFMDLFMSQGATELQAKVATEELMRLSPGLFLTEGNKAINPMAVSLYSSPYEIQQVIGALGEGWDKFLKELYDQGTPFVSILGALLEGVLNPNADPAIDRVVEALSPLNRDITYIKRLKGDQGKWFTYSDTESHGQRWLGSWFPKGINVEGVLDSADYKISREDIPGATETFEPREGVQTTHNTLQRYIDDLDKYGVTGPKRQQAEEALRVEYELQKRLDAAPRFHTGARKGDRINYWSAAKVVRDYIIELVPENAEAYKRAYRQANTYEKRHEYYDNIRARIRERYPWSNVKRYLDEQRAAAE